MKILFPDVGLQFIKATSGAGAGGLYVLRRLIMYPRGCYIGTKGSGSYSINAATFVNAFENILNNGGVYSFSNGNAGIARASTRIDLKCLWSEITGGVLLNDYSDAPPTPLAVDTTHVFSTLTSNYWHNSLVLNNKTSKTGATVVFNSTTRQTSALDMELQT